jgi:hypothetical protein
MPWNLQTAHTPLPWIPQGFACCDLFGVEFLWLWCIAKELMSVPQKMRLVLLHTCLGVTEFHAEAGAHTASVTHFSFFILHE